MHVSVRLSLYLESSLHVQNSLASGHLENGDLDAADVEAVSDIQMNSSMQSHQATDYCKQFSPVIRCCHI